MQQRATASADVRAPPTMSVLRNLEDKIAGLVEGTFGRVFKTEVRPVEVARKLAKEMDEHRTVSLSRTYVPNEYVVWLSPQDRAKYEGMEQEVGDELAGYLLEHARREKLSMVSKPKIGFATDEALGLGEFGIQVRTVRVDEAAPAQPAQGDHGQTMIYSTAERLRQPVEEQHERRRPERTRPFLVAEGKRRPIPPDGAVVGRSRECDVVLADSNVSRRHAELRPEGSGWVVRDLGSTNGVTVNGREVGPGGMALTAGDRVAFGTAQATFEVE